MNSASPISPSKPPPKYRILVISADPEVCAAIKAARNPSYEIACTVNGYSGVTLFQQLTPDLVILDDTLPDQEGLTVLEQLCSASARVPVIVVATRKTVSSALTFMKAGVYDYLSKPLDRELLHVMMRETFEYRTVKRQLASFQAEEEARIEDYYETSFVARGAMRDNLIAAKRIAEDDHCVFLQGERGTGKQTLACGIHHWSPRRARPFVVINCPAITERRLDLELFGCRTGDVNDEPDHIGMIEIAKWGTLLVEESGEMPIALQAQLLRVIEHGAFQRLDESEPVPVNVRIIVSTTIDLEAATKSARFLQDLFERLQTCHLTLPPLRDRLQDIPALVQLFLARYVNQGGGPPIRISSAALKALTQYKWPGNIRELENVIFRAAIVCSQNEIKPDDLFLG